MSGPAASRKLGSALAEKPGNRLIFRSPAASRRVRRAVDFLVARRKSAQVGVVGASADAAAQVARAASLEAGGSFGWYRFTLTRLAGTLASHALGSRGLTAAGPLSLEAICARIVHVLGTDGLGRFAAIADRPGLPRALARSLDELRMAGGRPPRPPPAPPGRGRAAPPSARAP